MRCLCLSSIPIFFDFVNFHCNCSCMFIFIAILIETTAYKYGTSERVIIMSWVVWCEWCPEGRFSACLCCGAESWGTIIMEGMILPTCIPTTTTNTPITASHHSMDHNDLLPTSKIYWLDTCYCRRPSLTTIIIRRIFDAASVTASASISFDATIPIPDLDSAVYINVPFSFSFPSERSLVTGRSFSSGGGLASGRDSPRTVLYKGIEKYMAHMTGADGQACLLRAMCEASSTPLHDEGLIGDAVTFLLTSNYATEESDERFKRYFAAQAKGQVWTGKNPQKYFTTLL